MSYRILLIYNKPEREVKRLQRIEDELLNLRADSVIQKLWWNDDSFLSKAIKFKPDAILTYPLSGRDLSVRIYIIKLFSGCLVTTYRTEGVYDDLFLVNPSNDRYGCTLLDLEFFWGNLEKTKVAEDLVREKKLSSKDRIILTGFIELEEYLGKPSLFLENYLDKEDIKTIESKPKDKIILIITGFHIADYTAEMFDEVKDMREEFRERFLNRIEAGKAFRASYIAKIRESAKLYPDCLFVVKTHPLENRSTYDELSEFENILLLDLAFPMSCILEKVGLFVHYGSTASADSYICGLPSIFVYSQKIENEFGVPFCEAPGMLSTLDVELDELPEKIGYYTSGQLSFEVRDENEALLYKAYNLERGKPYEPSKVIARFLLEKERRQRLSVGDFYLWRSLLIITTRGIRRFFRKLFTKSGHSGT